MSRVFDAPINTNDQSIDRVLAAGLPVALVFLNGNVSSELDQTIERLASRNAGQLLVTKIDKKENPETARRFRIDTTPSLVTVQKGQCVSQAESVTGAELEQHIAFLLGKGPKPVSVQQARVATANGGSGTPVTVTDATFVKDVLDVGQPVLVDFWAPWCGPCRMVEPTVKKLASEFAGRLRVAKINVDENPAISNQYGVQGIPTMIVFRNGQIADRWSGALPEPALRSRIQQFIGT